MGNKLLSFALGLMLLSGCGSSFGTAEGDPDFEGFGGATEPDILDGESSGGAASGGAASGGAASGDDASGDDATGGASTGGAATGGASTGDTSTGGAATGGATSETGGASGTETGGGSGVAMCGDGDCPYWGDFTAVNLPEPGQCVSEIYNQVYEEWIFDDRYNSNCGPHATSKYCWDNYYLTTYAYLRCP